MKKFVAIICVMGALVYAQDFRQNASASLFSDYKAISVGDAITIIVLESSQAENSASTQTGREGSVGFNASGKVDQSALPGVDLSVGSSNNFDGGGKTSSAGKISTRISATIDSVLANGNLRIQGSRKILINGEEQLVKIKGIVRPSDVQANNTVLSYNISDAEFEFTNDGRIGESNEPGWITKLFHWLF